MRLFPHLVRRLLGLVCLSFCFTLFFSRKVLLTETFLFFPSSPKTNLQLSFFPFFSRGVYLLLLPVPHFLLCLPKLFVFARFLGSNSTPNGVRSPGIFLFFPLSTGNLVAKECCLPQLGAVERYNSVILEAFPLPSFFSCLAVVCWSLARHHPPNRTLSYAFYSFGGDGKICLVFVMRLTFLSLIPHFPHGRMCVFCCWSRLEYSFSSHGHFFLSDSFLSALRFPRQDSRLFVLSSFPTSEEVSTLTRFCCRHLFPSIYL